jgi:outer membrane protein OmpA-like peptidoglycan-associated protein
MKRSIADLYACRKDFYDANKDTVAKVAAGYLHGCEELLDIKAKANKKDEKAMTAYKGILKMAQDIYGKDVLASDDDADGLIADAQLVGLPGNDAFFKGKGNLSGFEPRMAAALSMAVEGGWASKRAPLLAADLDFAKKGEIDKLAGGIKGKSVGGITAGAEMDKLLFTFKITFKPNQADFSEEEYGKDFKRAVELASLFGNAVVTVRGHVDPALFLKYFEGAAVDAKILTRADKGYMVKGGGTIDLDNPKDMKRIVEIVKKEDLSGAKQDLKKLLANLDTLSQKRANAVFDALQKYASGQDFKLDKNQIKPVGVGILEPAVTRARDAVNAARNRRVEFSIYSIRPKDHVAEGVEYDY